MAETGPKYTDKQRGIIERTVEPSTQEEWDFLQSHGNDILPKKLPKQQAQRLSGGKKLPDVEVPDWIND